jgi:hypothetical protein
MKLNKILYFSLMCGITICPVDMGQDAESSEHPAINNLEEFTDIGKLHELVYRYVVPLSESSEVELQQLVLFCNEPQKLTLLLRPQRMNGEQLNSFRQSLDDFVSAHTPKLRAICTEANIPRNTNTNQTTRFAAYAKICSAFNAVLTTPDGCLITDII